MREELLFYKEFVGGIISVGLKLNPYDPCVANNQIISKQMTVGWKTDGINVSHESKKIFNIMKEW